MSDEEYMRMKLSLIRDIEKVRKDTKKREEKLKMKLEDLSASENEEAKDGCKYFTASTDKEGNPMFDLN